MMTSKDKSLILFALSFVIILWFLLSFASSLFASISFFGSDLNQSISEKYSDGREMDWLNTSKPIESSDLKNRIILLDFWTYACVNCLHMVPEVKKLEEEFGNRLTVIGVHSGKFSNEKNSDSIKNAIIKYDIEHPVVNDAEMKIWNNFKVSAWPTLILLNPKGRVEQVYIGENNAEKIRADVKKLVKKYKTDLNRDPLPILLEKDKSAPHILKYPSKLEYTKEFSFKNIPTAPAIFIANTGGNSIIVTSLKGDILLKIGSSKEGFEDGDLSVASFSAPRGLLYKNGILYVADTGNHALRKINFEKNQVTTIIGSGIRGKIISKETNIKDADLASPWDLEFFPDSNNIIIANAGTHQLLQYNIAKEKIRPFAGSGREDIIDGKYPDNALAQTSGFDVAGGKLFFLDSETSSLRVADKEGNVKTLIGKGLFEFGNKNGSKDEALMQHPAGLVADESAVYIADAFNHMIRKYDLSSGKLSDYSGSGMRGNQIESMKKISYNEPEDILSILDKFYIADADNNRIVIINRVTGTASIFNVMPALKLQKDIFSEYLPNLEKIPAVRVKDETEITVIFQMKKGWKINEMGPSFFNLVEVKKKEAHLIASFDWNAIKSGSIKLPKLSSGKKYYLQGTVYYCEDKKDSLCLIKSYEQQLFPQKIGGEDEVKINFIYN